VTQPNAPVRLILDTSALLAYVGLSVDAGEVLHEIMTDPGARFGVPPVVAARAMSVLWDDDDRARLRDLLDHESCASIELVSSDWMELAWWDVVTGSDDRGACALASIRLAAPILSAEGHLYAHEDLLVIDLPR